MSKVKIQIGKAKKTEVSKREQIEDAGFGFQRNDQGEMSISIKFPGIDTLNFTRKDLGIVIDRLDAPTIEGSGPGASFARSASEDPNGNLTAKFSEEKRARSVSFSPSDRHEIADLLTGLLKSWDDYAAALIEKEAEKASETSNENDNAAAAK